MRFYFTWPLEQRDEGIDFPNTEAALEEAADAALLIARENPAEELKLEISSDEGRVATVIVKVTIERPAVA